MEQLFAGLAISSANLVGKAAFSYATKYAAKQLTSLMQQQINQQNDPDYQIILEETKYLHGKLLQELEVIYPAMDLCMSLSSQGNTYLKNIVAMGDSFKNKVENIGKLVQDIISLNNDSNAEKHNPKDWKSFSKKFEEVKNRIEETLDAVKELVPLLMLSMQTSGVSQRVYLSKGTSPSQLLKASHAITRASEKFDVRKRFGPVKPPNPEIIGSPTVVKLYSLSTFHSRKKGYDDFTWKLTFPKCELSVERVAPCENSPKQRLYILKIKQDLNDGLYHEDEDPNHAPCLSASLSNVHLAYYSTSGSLLKISENNVPVLVLKLSYPALETRAEDYNINGNFAETLEEVPEEQHTWYALELYERDDDEKIDVGNNNTDDTTSSSSTSANGDIATVSENDLSTNNDKTSNPRKEIYNLLSPSSSSGLDLSWVEYVIRLTSLEMKTQISHLDAKDELLCSVLLNDAKR